MGYVGTSSAGLTKKDKETVSNWMVEGHSIQSGSVKGHLKDYTESQDSQNNFKAKSFRAVEQVNNSLALMELPGAGYYGAKQLGQNIEIYSEQPGLKKENIKSGIEIFGIRGNLDLGYKPLVFANRNAYGSGTDGGQPGGGTPYGGAWYSANFTDLITSTGISLSEFGSVADEQVNGHSLPVFTVTKPGTYYVLSFGAFFSDRAGSAPTSRNFSGEIQLEKGAKFYIFLEYKGSQNGSGGASIAVFRKG